MTMPLPPQPLLLVQEAAESLVGLSIKEKCYRALCEVCVCVCTRGPGALHSVHIASVHPALCSAAE